MRFLATVLLFLYSAPVLAEEDASLEVLCRSLPEYQQGEGVEYKPGVEGVVPADLNPLNAAVPDVINIPITVKLAERFPALNIPADLELQPDAGLLSIHQGGRVEYNGQDISGQAYSACGKDEAVHGHVDEDTVNSEAEAESQPVIVIKEGADGMEAIEGQYLE